MKLFKVSDYQKLENPTPGEPHRPEILKAEHGFKSLGGMVGILPPGTQVPYHFHKERESVIMVIAGEAVQIIEGEELSISAGDVMLIPAGEKHQTINRSGSDVRYLEFFTCPPVTADFALVED